MPATVPTPPPPRPSKILDLALSTAAIAWFLAARELAARSAAGISQRLDFLAVGLVLKPLFLLFLLYVGLSVLEFIARRHTSLRDLLSLPARPTARQEFGIGAAIGWSAALLTILPLALLGRLHPQLWTEPRAFLYALLTLAGAAFAALALEIVFRGYALRRLIDALGPTGATLSMALLYGLLSAFSPGATVLAVLVTALFGLLLSLAWLRTHGVWLSWGLNFAFTVSIGLLFGLPVAGSTELSSIVQTSPHGPRLLSGGDFGPLATPLTAIFLLVAIAALIRLTRDFAWNYTHRLIVGAGYPMDVPPPAAHTAAMAATPTPPPPLVQILPSTSQQRSVPVPPPPQS